jgi:uncharacterized protein
MARLLIHVTCGPNDPNRAALALLVAASATEEGHAVELFLAGDAAQLIRNPVLDALQGLGTGGLRAHYDKIVRAGGRFHLSGQSSAARGVTAAEIEGKPARFATPNDLVRLAFECDRTLTY